MAATTTTSPPSRPLDTNTHTLLIGLSGPSSSGKTTLARFLRSIFNDSSPPAAPPQFPSLTLTILHLDDFYLTDALIPLVTTTPDCPSGLGSRQLQDWDCVESLDLPLLESTLRFVKQHGHLPPDSSSKEDQNSIGPTTVPDALVEHLQKNVGDWFSNLQSSSISSSTSNQTPTQHAAPATTALKIFILDGFLLYPPPNSHNPMHRRLHALTTATLDLKLFVPCTRAQTVSRRTNRAGYVTLEGFWQDPPGYVEDVVWPGFVRDHRWLYGADSESKATQRVDTSSQARPETQAEPDADAPIQSGEHELQDTIDAAAVAAAHGITVAPGGGALAMDDLLRWAVARLKAGVAANLPRLA